MIFILLICAILCLATVVLYRRLANTDRQVGEMLGAGEQGDNILQATTSLMQDEVWESCSPDILAEALEDVGKPLRIDQTKCIRIEDALRFLKAKCEENSVVALSDAFLAIYQLQCTLDISDARLKPSLDAIAQRLNGLEHEGKTVKNVHIIQRGEKIDTDTMWPFTSGGIVKQPLGAIIEFDDRSNFARARVLARS